MNIPVQMPQRGIYILLGSFDNLTLAKLVIIHGRNKMTGTLP